MQVMFFHGFLLGSDSSDKYMTTWTSRDGDVVWPVTCLPEELPSAEIFAVSYPGSYPVLESSRNDTVSLLAENLLLDLMHANIGQIPNCPVVLVGHSLGGLVIKLLCLEAYEESAMTMRRNFHGRYEPHLIAKLKNFLNNLKGIFYYGTPHLGLNMEMDVAAHAMEDQMSEYFIPLNASAKLLTRNFGRVSRIYKWETAGLRETRPVKSGLFKGFILAPDSPSSAEDVNFPTVDADHFDITRPVNKASPGFEALLSFLNRLKLPENFQSPPKRVIGIENRVEEVISLLRDSSSLCIVGRGGIGKTTLARDVFNKLNNTRFEYSCFVSDVRMLQGDVKTKKKEIWERLHRHGELVRYQSDWSIDEKELLLVLDDVSGDTDREVLSDLVKDFHRAGKNSRLIVTTRDRGLSTYLGLNRYEVFPLNKKKSKELFLAHSFPKTERPPAELETVVDAIVKKCDGLPLALEVLGKYLKKMENYQSWRETLDAINKGDFGNALNQGESEPFSASLRLSYNALGENEQQIFLDATTFFCNNNNWTLREAKVAWREVYRDADRAWETLVDRSLVYDTKEDDSIKVHALLQSLGRRIAVESQNYSRCRLLGDEETTLNAQTKDQSGAWLDGKEIYAMRFVNDKEEKDIIHINGSVLFPKLKELLLLELNVPVMVDENVHQNSFPTKLVLLKFLGRQIGQVLFNPSLQPRLVVLKVFDSPALSYHQFGSFHTLPKEFGRLSYLKSLQFDSCYELQSLTESFGHLKSLEHLEFKNCEALRRLPESFGELKALSHLIFRGSANLKFMPGTFHNLRALSHLQFVECPKLTALPLFFHKLSALTCLQIVSCQALDDLSASFGNLSALNHLTVVNCKNLQSLPDSFGKLGLRQLTFVDCENLHSLPESFGDLSYLMHLAFIRCNKLQLPQSFGKLSSLEHFALQYCDTAFDSLAEADLVKLEGLRFLSIASTLWRLRESFPELIDRHRTKQGGNFTPQDIPSYIKRLPSLRTLELNFKEPEGTAFRMRFNVYNLSCVVIRIDLTNDSKDSSDVDTDSPRCVIGLVGENVCSGPHELSKTTTIWTSPFDVSRSGWP